MNVVENFRIQEHFLIFKPDTVGSNQITSGHNLICDECCFSRKHKCYFVQWYEENQSFSHIEAH